METRRGAMISGAAGRRDVLSLSKVLRYELCRVTAVHPTKDPRGHDGCDHEVGDMGIVRTDAKARFKDLDQGSRLRDYRETHTGSGADVARYHRDCGAFRSGTVRKLMGICEGGLRRF